MLSQERRHPRMPLTYSKPPDLELKGTNYAIVYYEVNCITTKPNISMYVLLRVQKYVCLEGEAKGEKVKDVEIVPMPYFSIILVM